MTYASRTIEEYLSSVASEAVTPAGGSTAAVVGAAGAALCEMVCVHTTATDRSDRENEGAPAPADLTAAGETLAARRADLLRLADADARAVDDLLAANERETAARKRSTGVPLTVARACADVLEAAVVVAAAGTPPALPDAGSGALFARAALGATVYTVRTNVEQVDDPAFAARMRRRADAVERDGEAAFGRVAATLGIGTGA